MEFFNINKKQITVEGLERGEKYSFRISAGSIWGYGPPTLASPSSIRVSCWNDLGEGPSYSEPLKNANLLTELFDQVERFFR